MKSARNQADINQSNAAANSKASAEQTGLENQYIKEYGEKMGAGGANKNFLTAKDYAGMIKEHLTLGKGQMGLDPTKEERDQQVMERAITYAQKHLNRQPSLAEVLAAERLRDGEKRKFPDESIRSWSSKLLKWEINK